MHSFYNRKMTGSKPEDISRLIQVNPCFNNRDKNHADSGLAAVVDRAELFIQKRSAAECYAGLFSEAVELKENAAQSGFFQRFCISRIFCQP